MKTDGTQNKFRICKLFGFIGLERTEIKEAQAGEMVAVSGMEDINIGETICPQDHPEALPILRIDEPTLQMTFLVNNSPFAGKEGDYRSEEHTSELQLRGHLVCRLL